MANYFGMEKKEKLLKRYAYQLGIDRKFKVNPSRRLMGGNTKVLTNAEPV